MSAASTPSAGVHEEYQRLSAIGPPGHPKVGALIRLVGEDVSRIVRGHEKHSTPGLFGVVYTKHVLDDDRRVVLKGKGRVRAEHGLPFINESDPGAGGVAGARRHLVKHDAARKSRESAADNEIRSAIHRGSMRAFHEGVDPASADGQKFRESKMAEFRKRAEALGLKPRDDLEGGAKRRRKNSTRKRRHGPVRRRTARKKTRQRKPKRTLSKRKKNRGTRRRNR